MHCPQPRVFARRRAQLRLQLQADASVRQRRRPHRERGPLALAQCGLRVRGRLGERFPSRATPPGCTRGTGCTGRARSRSATSPLARCPRDDLFDLLVLVYLWLFLAPLHVLEGDFEGAVCPSPIGVVFRRGSPCASPRRCLARLPPRTPRLIVVLHVFEGDVGGALYIFIVGCNTIWSFPRGSLARPLPRAHRLTVIIILVVVGDDDVPGVYAALLQASPC